MELQKRLSKSRVEGNFQNIIGGDVGFEFEVIFRFAAVAGADESRPKPGGDARFDVESFVADEPRIFHIDVNIGLSLFDHTKPRLAAFAAGIRQMRTKVKSIDGVSRAFLYRVVDRVHCGFVIKSAGDAGLIRDNDDPEAQCLRSFQSFVSKRKKPQILDTRKKIYLFDQRPVAIHKNNLLLCLHNLVYIET